MSYRTIEINWLPQSNTEWRTFTQARKEAARLWSDLVVRHHRIRRLNWKWPSKGRWQKWARRKYPNLSAQSAQQVIGEFCEAVNATRQLRKNGHTETRYPWRKPRYRDVVYTNQDARIRDGRVILPTGRSGTLRVRIPDTVTVPARLMEVRLCYGRVLLVCEIPDESRPQATVVGVDLGVNTLIAASDGKRAILVSGREAKATVQWRNKRLASIQARQSQLIEGSRRWKRLQRRKRKMLDKARRRMRDICHKATRKVADAFPNATCYVGKPFNDAGIRIGRKQAQQVSQAWNARLISQLDSKTAGALVVSEAYSSQTCPGCGERSKHRRVFKCKCGATAPRDVIGATNILALGHDGDMAPGRSVPNAVQFVHPLKVSRHKPGSSPGHGASSLSPTGESPTRRSRLSPTGESPTRRSRLGVPRGVGVLRGVGHSPQEAPGFSPVGDAQARRSRLGTPRRA
ncbi:MAG: transposase [Ardenticatenaceae bacterium]|nr:transposase [Ardenticatenaceae bacterium]